MKETKPRVILKKYQSILGAALIVEIVSFAVSLTDSVVAANVIGLDAFTAIGLVSPFFSIATFLTAVINSGTNTNYSYQIGQYNKKRAWEFFGLGVNMAVVSGVLFTVLLILLKKPFMASIAMSDAKMEYLNQYYNIIVFYFMMAPISALLDNIVVADGGEKLSATSNVIQIAGNVILSIVFAKLFGVRGIAAATVLCKAVFILMICFWFFGKKNTIHYVFHFSWADALQIIRRGFVRATTFAANAFMILVLNRYLLNHYEETIYDVWVIVQKIIGLSSVFLGMSMTLQPLISTLNAEKNTKAIRQLTKRAAVDIMVASLILSVLMLCFTKTTLRIFGVVGGELMEEGIRAVRTTSLTLVFLAMAVFFFIYYFLVEKNALAVTLCLLKDFACVVGIVVLLTYIIDDNPDMVWDGVAAAPVLAIIILTVYLLSRYGMTLFPLLLPRSEDENILIYSFELTEEKIAEFAQNTAEILESRGISRIVNNRICFCIEDVLLLVREKNREAGNPAKGKREPLNSDNGKSIPEKGNRKPKKDILAECTIIFEEDGIRLIFRDTGLIFDFTDDDTRVESFRSYVVSRMLGTTNFKNYITTTGYNRNELFFKEC